MKPYKGIFWLFCYALVMYHLARAIDNITLAETSCTNKSSANRTDSSTIKVLKYLSWSPVALYTANPNGIRALVRSIVINMRRSRKRSRIRSFRKIIFALQMKCLLTARFLQQVQYESMQKMKMQLLVPPMLLDNGHSTWSEQKRHLVAQTFLAPCRMESMPFESAQISAKTP